MKAGVALLASGLLLALCAEAGAQARRDPLNPREVEELRENAQQPKKRIELLISFAKERMLAVDRLCGSGKMDADKIASAQSNAAQSDAARAIPPDLDSGKVAELLGDLAAVIDELDDNLEMYGRHSEDLRRPLREVLDTEAEFRRKLETLNASATPLQKRRLAAALEDALESVKSSSESAQAMLTDQVAKKGEEKDKGKPERREARE